MTRRRLRTSATIVLCIFALAATAVVLSDRFFAPKTITAYFVSATAVYPNDEVRVAGVKVGSITAIDPAGEYVKVTLSVDHRVPLPADAKAVIVAANLLAARYVELTPAYESHTGGPQMTDHAVIPIDRTAVPVEWDEVKTQLMRMATELGPNSQVSEPAIARFIDSTSNALNGNGDKLRQTLTQLAGVGRILADGSGNIAGTIKSLQTLVSTLRDTNPQIVQFQGRFATLTSVLDDNRSDLDAALKNLSSAIGDVRGFLTDTRDKTSEQVQRLADVTSNLVAHRDDLEQLLHVTPNAIANGYADYNADTGTILGSVSFNNFSNPMQFVCAAIGAVKNTTSAETAKLCADYLGPALNTLNFNNLPFPINPVLVPTTRNVIYTDPALAPGAAGSSPAVTEQPPSISAYTGLGGDSAPAGGQQIPGAVGPTTVDGMLLPEQSTAPLPVPPGPPTDQDGTPPA